MLDSRADVRHGQKAVGGVLTCLLASLKLWESLLPLVVAYAHLTVAHRSGTKKCHLTPALDATVIPPFLPLPSPISQPLLQHPWYQQSWRRQP